MPKVKLISRPSWGVDGINTDEGSAIFRPLRILRDQGKPPGVLSFAYLASVWERHGDLTEAELARLVRKEDETTWVRTLGSFCYTAGGRILFTPGWHGMGIWNRSCEKDELHGDFVLDHITLEPNLQSWHATSTSGKHLGTFRTAEAGGGGRRWFYVVLESERLLEPTMSVSELEIEVATGDEERWGKEAVKACKSAAGRLVKPGDNRVNRTEPSFLHFEFFVTPRGARPKASPMLPALPPKAGNRNPAPQGVAFIEYDFDLPGCPIQIWMAAARIQGTLNHPVWIGESRLS